MTEPVPVGLDEKGLEAAWLVISSHHPEQANLPKAIAIEAVTAYLSAIELPPSPEPVGRVPSARLMKLMHAAAWTSMQDTTPGPMLGVGITVDEVLKLIAEAFAYRKELDEASRASPPSPEPIAINAGMVLVPVSPDIAAFLAGVEGVIEATREEQMGLWKAYTQEYASTWTGGTSGYLVTVGRLADMPVCISVLVPEIDGRKVLVWHPTSQVVDHRLIDTWLDQALPGVRRSDATNSHIVAPFKKAGRHDRSLSQGEHPAMSSTFSYEEKLWSNRLRADLRDRVAQARAKLDAGLIDPEVLMRKRVELENFERHMDPYWRMCGWVK